jgi:DNA-binding GntR family transcriptional regulator
MGKEQNNNKISLKEFAYRKIGEWLIEDKLLPGEALLESDLAARLQISRTPIREALSQLAQEGLVEIIPRRGAFVARITLEDIRELFEIREALEGIAARLAATKAEQPKLEEIEGLFRSAEKQNNQKKRLELFEEAGNRMHEYIIRASDNRRIGRIIDTNRTLLRKEQHISASIPGEIENSIKEHKAILKALKGRDAHLAEELMRKHIISTLNGLLVYYRK